MGCLRHRVSKRPVIKPKWHLERFANYWSLSVHWNIHLLYRRVQLPTRVMMPQLYPKRCNVYNIIKLYNNRTPCDYVYYNSLKRDENINFTRRRAMVDRRVGVYRGNCTITSIYTSPEKGLFVMGTYNKTLVITSTLSTHRLILWILLYLIN